MTATVETLKTGLFEKNDFDRIIYSYSRNTSILDNVINHGNEKKQKITHMCVHFRTQRAFHVHEMHMHAMHLQVHSLHVCKCMFMCTFRASK